MRGLTGLASTHDFRLSIVWGKASLVLAFAIWLASGLPVSSAITLAEKGKSSYRIIISTNALPSERYAAEELQGYLKKISGTTLPIVTDDQRETAREIILGDNAHFRSLGIKEDIGALGTDGFLLRTDHKRLIITGGKPRGTLFGVYALLEEKLGVRWFTPELEVVPQTNRLVLPTLNETQVPALEYREVYWTEMLRDPDFAARHRLNGNHYALTDKHSGRAAVYFPFVHSMDRLVPPELYTEHPEYFPLINGKRVNGYVQRCLSNPEVVKLAIARVRHWIKKHPDATIISVSQNDTGNWCQCETCKALDDAEGSPAASLIRFVNAVAADIEKDYPKIRIDTLAYQYTRRAAQDNSTPRQCHHSSLLDRVLLRASAGDMRLQAQPPLSQRYPGVGTGGSETLHLGLYAQFRPLPATVSQFRRAATECPLCRARVKGLFEQGNYSSGGNGELGPLRAYLLAEMLWNPKTDTQKHINEFLHAYYGNAAAKLSRLPAIARSPGA